MQNGFGNRQLELKQKRLDKKEGKKTKREKKIKNEKRNKTMKESRTNKPEWVRPNSGLESTIFGGSTLMPTKVRMDGWTYRRLDRKYSVSSEELHLIKVEMKKKVRRQVNRSLKKI